MIVIGGINNDVVYFCISKIVDYLFGDCFGLICLVLVGGEGGVIILGLGNYYFVIIGS